MLIMFPFCLSRKIVLINFCTFGIWSAFVSTGHSGSITCMMVPKNTNHLMTGSEDTSVIVWDIKTQAVKTRLW